jgi:crossover junction endonuclease EME1
MHRMKALVALPKVSGACAIAIAKKYPSMNALFEAYLDPSKTVMLSYSPSAQN